MSADDDWETAGERIAAAVTKVPAPTVKGQWDDEDAPEPEPKEAPKPVSTAPPPKPKALSKAKQAAKEREAELKAQAEEKARAADPKLKAQHKKDQQALLEDGDRKIAEELFAGAGIGGPKTEKRSGADPLKDLVLAKASDFDQFAKDVALKVLPTEADKDRKNAVLFIKALFKYAAERVQSDELRDLSSSLTVTLNEKIRDEASSKKKKGTAKKGGPTLAAAAKSAKSVIESQVAVSNSTADEYDFL